MASIILIGDSDISRWPPSLYPSVKTQESPFNSSASKNNNNASNVEIKNFGESGAELSCLLHQTRQWRDEEASNRNSCYTTNNKHSDRRSSGSKNIFVACAGENDVGSGRSIDKILETFRTFLDELFPLNGLHSSSNQISTTKNPKTTTTVPTPAPTNNNHLVFLGPKFEPWLTDDYSSRKQYTKLSNGFQRTIRKHHGFASGKIVYIDCLTLFCTKETANIPGAVHGGRAMPDDRYFDGDGLHLSDEGYCVWKEIVDMEISSLII